MITHFSVFKANNLWKEQLDWTAQTVIFTRKLVWNRNVVSFSKGS